jgi:hypothetical protein
MKRKKNTREEDTACDYQDEFYIDDIAAEYDDVGAFHDGYACVKKNGRYGFIDRKGVAVIPAIYRDCQPYVTKKYPCRFDCEAEFFPVLVKVKSKYGFVDIHGKEVIAPVYADALPFCGDITAAILGGKAGFIDETGKVVIPFMYEPDFSEIFNYRFLGDDPANVKLNGKWGVINRNNNTVLPFLYDEFLLNHNAGWRLAMRDGRKVSVDRKGVERLLQKNPDAPTFKDFLKNVTWQEVKPYFLAMDVALYQTEESLSIFATCSLSYLWCSMQPYSRHSRLSAITTDAVKWNARTGHFAWRQALRLRLSWLIFGLRPVWLSSC